MCKCCEDVKFLKQIYSKERFRFYARITSISKGGTTNHNMYDLNFCPICGRELGGKTK